MDDKKLVYALAVIAFAIIAWLEWTAPTEDDRDAKLWNNGFCSCGSSWEYDRAVPDRGVDVYYFRCKNCNDVIGLRTRVFAKSR